MTLERVLQTLFDRFGVPLSVEEARRHAGLAPREAILMLLADREIAARFDSAHGRPPEESDIDELADIYAALEKKI